MLKNIVFIFLVAFQIYSCKKENDPENHFITYHLQDYLSGTVYSNCNLQPAINRQVTIIIQSVDYDVLIDDTIAQVMTDSLGHFSYSVNFTVTSTEPPSYFFIVDTTYKIVRSPVTSPINIVIHDTAHVVVKIEAFNSYTSSDTLYYKIADFPYNKLAGPFSSGVINIINDPQWFYVEDTSRISVVWAIGYENLPGNFTMNAVFTTFALNHISCSNSDTVILNIN